MFGANLSVEDKAFIEKLSLKEKDILVIKVKQELEVVESEKIIRMIENILRESGHDNNVMLLDGDANLMVIEDRQLLDEIPLQPVVSSNILSIGYSHEKAILRVKFKNDGIYDYKNVPDGHYMKIMVAPSKSRYLNEEIKGKFEFIKLN